MILSIDGGGSKVLGLIFNPDTMDVERIAIGGSVKHRDIGLGDASRNLARVIGELVHGYDVSLGVIGLTGLDVASDYDRWNNILIENIGGAFRHILIHDVEMALYAATNIGPGIIVIAGTGVNVAGWNGSEMYKAGDWGWRIGDEGGGYYIGSRILNAVFRHIDGRLNDYELYARVMEYIGARGLDELLEWVYNASPRDIADISILGCRIYGSSGTVRHIFDEAIGELIKSIKAVVERLGRTYPVNYTGGMFKCRYFREVFLKRLGDAGLEPGLFVEHPILGGVYMALRSLKIDYDPGLIRDRVNRSIDKYLKGN